MLEISFCALVSNFLAMILKLFAEKYNLYNLRFIWKSIANYIAENKDPYWKTLSVISYNKDF